MLTKFSVGMKWEKWPEMAYQIYNISMRICLESFFFISMFLHEAGRMG